MSKAQSQFVKPQPVLDSERPQENRDNNAFRAENEVFDNREHLFSRLNEYEEQRAAAITKWETERRASRAKASTGKIPSTKEMPPDSADPKRWKEFFQSIGFPSSRDRFYEEVAKARATTKRGILWPRHCHS